MKPRLTPEQHTDLGRTLAGIRDELRHRSTQLANAYPRTGRESVVGKKLEDAVDALEEARCALDNAFAQEHPGSFEATAYYPDPEDRSRVVAAAYAQGVLDERAGRLAPRG